MVKVIFQGACIVLSILELITAYEARFRDHAYIHALGAIALAILACAVK